MTVLYDDLLPKELDPKVSRHTVGFTGNGNVTFRDINRRPLAIPSTATPFRRALLWVAEVSCRAALTNRRPHLCATPFIPASWETIIRACEAGSPDSAISPMMRRYLDEL